MRLCAGEKLTSLDPDLRRILANDKHYVLENRTHDFLLSTAETFPFLDPGIAQQFFEVGFVVGRRWRPRPLHTTVV